MKGLPGVPKHLISVYTVDVTKIVFTGHSNGGQGAWWMASHYPDKTLARNQLPFLIPSVYFLLNLVVAASSYVKSEFYVPMLTRSSDTFIDPIMRGVNQIFKIIHFIPYKRFWKHQLPRIIWIYMPLI